MRSTRRGGMGKSLNLAKEQLKAEAVRKGMITDDLGLLPDTIVMPRGEKRPSWFRAFRGRYRLEEKRWMTRGHEFMLATMLRFMSVRPRPKLDFTKVKTIAADLYEELYSHFAAGDISPIESKLCSGLRGSLGNRIASRPSDSQMRWKLLKHLSKPRTVSYKCVTMPLSETAKMDPENAFGMVQAVVRLHTLQSLHYVKRVRLFDGAIVSASAPKDGSREIMVDAAGREIAPEKLESRAKESVEYVVVQQLICNSKFQPWTIWGMTEETTLAKLDKDEADKAAREQKMRQKLSEADAA